MSRLSEAWRDAASCAHTGAPEEWFPHRHEVINPLALRICANCPAWRACLLYVLASPEIRHGIWAGLSPREITGLREELLDGLPGAELIEQARWIVEHRTDRTRYQPLAWDRGRAEDDSPLRQQGEWVRSILYAADLLDELELRRDDEEAAA